MIKKKKIKKKKLLLMVLFIIILSVLSFYFLDKSINTKTRINFDYSEKGSTNYKVYLKENPFYEVEYLEQDMQYVSGLIDYIDIDFNYIFESLINVDYNYNYDISAKVIITEKSDSNKVLYLKEEILLKEQNKTKNNTNNYIIDDNIKINYNKYNTISEDFRREYALSVDSYLLITLNIDTEITNLKNFDNLDSNNKLTVKIPLSVNTIGIIKNDIDTQNNEYIISNTEIVNKVYFVIYLLITLIDVIGIIILYIIIRNFLLRKKTPYMKKLNKILKEYDRAIVKTKEENYNLDDYNVIEIESFEELLDARDNLNNMILYIDIEPEKESWFILIYNNTVYRYILRESDLN